jgi:hypothetical protein
VERAFPDDALTTGGRRGRWWERMATGSGQERAPRPPSRLFAVRVWTEEVAGRSEFRGSVRDVVTGAYCHFRDWSDLSAFLVARMDEDERAGTGRGKGDDEWLSPQRR